MRTSTSINNVCVLGLGYIGLPTAAMFATHGKRVTGVDVNPRIVDGLLAGKTLIDEPGLREVVRDAVASGRLRAQLTPAENDAFIIAVPTPQCDDHLPDLRHVTGATESIVPYLRPGNTVILESTSPPGTTMALIPILERSGLRVGDEIHLAHSPERVLPGRILVEMAVNDRVIGGCTPEAARAAAALYGSFVTGEIHLTDATTAEMAKLMENTYRDVNIALANEFSRIGAGLGLDTQEAIRLANRHPRVNILQPGPGVGGHCIAVDPWFIVDAVPEQARLIRTAREVNDAQPAYVVELITSAVREIARPRIAILGLAYKADIDDVRESPALEVVHLLRQQGFELRLHDAHAAMLPDGTVLESDLTQALGDADALVILTDHAEYRMLQPDSAALSVMRHRVVVDTRRCLERERWLEAGYDVHQLGVGEGRRMAGLELTPC